MSHPIDDVVTEYHKLLAERRDLDRQLAKLKPIQERQAKIDQELDALRPKLTASPAQ